MRLCRRAGRTEKQVGLLRLTRAIPSKEKRIERYQTMVPGLMVPSFGTTMMPFRM